MTYRQTMAILAAAFLVVGSSEAAMAQNSVSTPPVPAMPPVHNSTPPSSSQPAPVPHSVPDMVAPSERIHGAGPSSSDRSSSGPADATPFSSTPETVDHPLVR